MILILILINKDIKGCRWEKIEKAKYEVADWKKRKNSQSLYHKGQTPARNKSLFLFF